MASYRGVSLDATEIAILLGGAYLLLNTGVVGKIGNWIPDVPKVDTHTNTVSQKPYIFQLADFADSQSPFAAVGWLFS